MPEIEPSPQLTWLESGTLHHARWQSASGLALPKKVFVADDTLPAGVAYKLVCEGTALLWRGDFHQGRQMVQSLGRRIDKARDYKASKAKPQDIAPKDMYYAYRQAQAQRARVLGLVVVELAADYWLPLRRAPDMREACTQAWGEPTGASCIVSLRELMGIVAAYEWRKNGVSVPALADMGDGKIHPYYGVFAPIRSEYVELVAKACQQRSAPIDTAFDIGTGTGVLAAVLAKYGAKKIIGTEQDQNVIACANDNITRLAVNDVVQIVEADLFPEGLADIIVCNPPWLPGKPSSRMEQSIFDADSKMLRGFLNGLRAHLAPKGEGWLIMSDLAEHLGLRAEGELAKLIEAAGLIVRGKLDARPTHPKTQDETDPLHVARSREVTTLWRLVAAT
ncbi:MAG: class I SAM-dependent methyltransferase [Burkholderiales bacterium]